jgi:DNA-binding IclR family transcriptional regulator
MIAREQGYSFSFNESGNESWALAVPVIKHGVFIGVLAVLTPVSRYSESLVETYRHSLIGCRHELERALSRV